MKIEPLSEEVIERLVEEGYTHLVPRYKYIKDQFGMPFKLKLL